MRLKLIEVNNRPSGPFSEWRSKAIKKATCPPLALPIVASLTSPELEVSILDERNEVIDFNIQTDVVGISFKSMAAKRAYEVADRFREKAVKVIMGGVHASLLPEEAIRHADSVVIGEAESVWQTAVNDMKKNKLKPFYSSSEKADLKAVPLPRFHLLKNDKYLYHAIQISRGCSLGCEFCPTRFMFGWEFRLKDISQVVQEVEAVQRIGKKEIFFVDDIFGAGKKGYIIELTKRLKPLRLEYVIISDFKIINDEELLKHLVKSGCKIIGLNVGLPDQDSEKIVKKVQHYGIAVWGYFMFGFENHTEDIFEKTIKFIKETNMRYCTLTVLAPYPNTPLYQQLEREGRILSKDWSLYDQAHVIFKPKLISAEVLENGYRRVLDETEALLKKEGLGGGT